MTAQSYRHPTAIQRMRDDKCPECGGAPESHGNDPRFWMPINQGCNLMERGVLERIDWRRHLDAEATR